ncbi:MAG: glycosyltransferase family 2 protein [Proteobacteria bacterium]|nr:glycosyltransferase family 2 protein [Pseudomonadota bacterium]
MTIMIPTYNQERFIAEAIESALAQSHTNLEVVVADDCSTDRTGEIASRYAADPRFRYERNSRNLGRVGNYRHSIYQKARGDWYLNLDGDDYLTDRDFIAKAIAVAQSDPDIVLVFGNAMLAWDGAAHGSLMSRKIRGPIIMSGKDFILTYPPFISDLCPPHLATLIKRETALASDFYRDEGICCDSESVYRVAFGKRLAIIDDVAGVWRQHGNNDSLTDPRILFESNAVRAKGIFQWAQQSRAFNQRELSALESKLKAGLAIAKVARAVNLNRFWDVPKAAVSSLAATGRDAHHVAKWLAVHGTRFTARRTARVLAQNRALNAAVKSVLTPASAAALRAWISPSRPYRIASTDPLEKTTIPGKSSV